MGSGPILVQEFSPAHHDNSPITLTPLTPHSLLSSNSLHSSHSLHSPHIPHTSRTPSVFTLKSFDSNRTLFSKSSSVSLDSTSKLHTRQSVISMIRVDTHEEESSRDEGIEGRGPQSPHSPIESVTIPKVSIIYLEWYIFANNLTSSFKDTLILMTNVMDMFFPL